MIPLTEEQLKAVVDGVFAFAETKLHRPLLVLALNAVQNAVDNTGIPALWQFLQARGVVK